MSRLTGASLLLALPLLVSCSGSGAPVQSAGSPVATASAAATPSSGGSPSPAQTTSSTATGPTPTGPTPTGPTATGTTSAATAYQPVVLSSSSTKSTRGATTISSVRVTSVTGVPAVTSAAIAARVRTLDDDAIAAFDPGSATAPSGSGGFQVEDQAAAVAFDDQYVSVGFSSYSYSGGAHGGTATTVSVFNRSTGALLTPDAFIAAGQTSAFYTAMQKQVRALLPGVVGSVALDDVTEGTGIAELEKVQVFPRTDGLAVVFGEYQVASYAEGQVYVVVPWQSFGSALASGSAPTSPVPAPAVRSGAFELTTGAAEDNAMRTTFDMHIVAYRKEGYTLAAVTGAQPQDSASSYTLFQLVPLHDPGAAVTITLKNSYGSTGQQTSTLLNVAAGTAACTGLPAALVTETTLSC